MLDVGWSELLVIGAVALVAVGPKDLPKVMRTIGIWAGKARRMVLGFQHDMERLAAEAEKVEREKAQDQGGAPPQRHEGPVKKEEDHDVPV